jgi:peptidoglycan/LPS O-acetylase OafA/YrhL
VYLAGLVLWRVGDLVRFKEFFMPADFMLYYTFFGRAGEFVLGMWLADRYLARDAGRPLRVGLPWRSVAGLVGIALCLIVLSQYRGLRSVTAFTGFINSLNVNGKLFSVFILTNNAALPLSIALLFSGLLCERSLLRSLFRTGPMVLLGKSSYVFFLIHTGVVRRLLWSVTPNHLAVFLVINVISVLVYLLVEEPLRKVIRSIGSHRPAEGPVLAQSAGAPI